MIWLFTIGAFWVGTLFGAFLLSVLVIASERTDQR